MDKITSTEQDYLKAIYKLEIDLNAHDSIVNINSIAERLGVSAPSTTKMMKRLSNKGLITYIPYKGASLTKNGIDESVFIIKTHRVWETFLVNKLGYDPQDVHDEAEKLEHASSQKLTEKLFEFLNFPTFDPHGAKIPQQSLWSNEYKEINLSDASLQRKYRIINSTKEWTDYIDKMHCQLPHIIKIESELIDGGIIVRDENTNVLLIPNFIKDGITVIESI